MMAATKKLMSLSSRQLATAKAWFSFLGNVAEIDKIMCEKISKYGTIILTDRECQIFLRWWNYLPSNLIEERDRDLYDTIKEFLYSE
jgi:hypothetical protein